MLLRSRRAGLQQSARRRGRYVSAWLRRHPQVMRHALWTVVFVAGLSVIVQLAYPAGRTLPGVAVQHMAVGGKTSAAVAKQLDESFAKAVVVFQADKKSIRTSLAEVGADVDGLATARAAADYPLGLRFVPFSSVAIMLMRDTPTVMRYDNERLQTYVKRIEKEAFAPAVNATVRIRGDDVALVPDQPQRTYPARAVQSLVESTSFAPRTTLTMQPQTKAAPRTDQEVRAILDQAKKAVATPLTLEVSGVKTAVDKATIGSWLYFPEDADGQSLRLAVKPDALEQYFASHQPRAYKPAGTTKIQVIDGREVGRVAGAAGQGVDVQKTADAVQAALKKGEKTTVPVPLTAIPPTVVYERTYSNSDAGLKAMLDAAAGSYGVAVMELHGRSANTNGTRQFVSASIYKLYIAYAVAKEVEAGRMRWDDPFNGQTVASCFDKMIVVSDNACPKAFGAKFGWQAVEDMMHGLGLSSATQMSPANYTTANDVALFLYKLQNGALLSADSTGRLLDAMKRQSYTRAGIPAGAQGSVVADKVGDVDGYKHDAAIVYGPKGPYILIVMTSGGSWSGIAAVTAQIHDYLKK